ncbi:MAG: YncE family protein [Euzebya sp.]
MDTSAHATTVVDSPSAGRPMLLVALAVAVVGIGLWAAGFGIGGVGARGGAVDPRMLVVNDDGAVSLIDVDSGQATYTVPGAVPTRDLSTLLTAWPGNDGNTVLFTRDAANGQVTGRTTLPGDLDIRTVSPQGGAVALLPAEHGPGLYLPQPRSRTRLTVAYTDERPSRTYDLPGNIEPEMFSVAEDALFVLSFDPPMEPSSYSVQRLDLATGELADTASPQVGLNPKMAGKARAQVLNPDGTFLYTLYTMTDGPTRTPDGDRWAFIHVINLDEQWSFCIFLDAPVGTGEEAAIGLGMDPDGDTLYVADSSTSTVTRVDTQTLTAQPPQHLEQLRPSTTTAAITVAPDDAVYVSSAGTVVQVDPQTLEPVTAWGLGDSVDGLAVFDNQLRVAVDGEVVLIDRQTYAETGVLRPPGGGQLQLLGPPAGSASRFPVECAC